MPLYAAQFQPDAFGVFTEFYAYVAFLIVLLSYGMETALFRFVNTEKDNPRVFSTALSSLLISTTAFLIVALAFSQPIASAMQYPDHANYVVWFALILSLDTLVALPFALLRIKNRPIRFATYKLINIGVNVILSGFFIWFCKNAYDAGANNWLADLYKPEIGVGYIFISNLVASAFTFILFLPVMRRVMDGFDTALFKRMLKYSLPLVFVGFAGIINETFDRALLKYLLPGTLEERMTQLGIYGACYKLAMLMSLFIQAFRYAAEPFFFNRAADKGSKLIYARVLNYFVIAGALIFLVISLFIDLFKYFIPNEAYWEGLHVVPILLLANLFLGVYVNLSIWYKLTDKTHIGAIVSIVSAALTIALNIWLIPVMGYEGSAWATLAVYIFLSVASWVLGRKYYPVPYNVGKVVTYVLLILLLYKVDLNYVENAFIHPYALKLLLLTVFAALVVAIEHFTTTATNDSTPV